MPPLDQKPDALLDVVRVSGRSMLPLIPGHSLVRCRSLAASDLRLGDVVICRLDGRSAARRFVERREHGGRVEIRQKGDNEVAGQWIGVDAAVWKATRIIEVGSERVLDESSPSRRIRLLTALSRAEAHVSDAYPALKGRRPVWRVAAPILAALAVGLRPLRRLVYALPVTAYPRVQRAPAEQERQLLLALMKGSPAAAPPERPVDWMRFLEEAIPQGMAPAASARRVSGLPPHAAEILERSALQAVRFHRAGLTAVSEIHHALSSAGIQYAVLKGPHLYAAYYEDAFPRPYGDLDLLVAPNERARAVRALSRLGYREAEGRLTGLFLRAVHFHVVLENRDANRPRIELHWSLVDRANLYRAGGADVLARARDFTAGDKTFRVPRGEDLFIYLCMHIAKHGLLNRAGLRLGKPATWFVASTTGNLLLWFMDLQRILERDRTVLDWEVLQERAREWNALEDVLHCLRLLRLLNPELPADCLPSGLAMDREPPGLLDRVLAGGLDGGLWNRMLQMSPALLFRPVRLVMLGRLLFPVKKDLAGYYRTESRVRLALLRLAHPFLFAARGFRVPAA